MAKSFPLSPTQSAVVLDHAPMSVFVSSVDGHGLLYAIRLARETFLTE